ncbi:hypothetical protein ACTFIW_004590 [Dictyostelium discoideum]
MTSFNSLYEDEDNNNNNNGSSSISSSSINNNNSNSKNGNPLSLSSMIPIRNRKLSDPTSYDNNSNSINIENDYLMENHQSPNNSSNNLLPFLIPSVNLSSDNINNSENSNSSSNNNNNNSNNYLSNSMGGRASSLSLGSSSDNAYIKNLHHGGGYHNQQHHNYNQQQQQQQQLQQQLQQQQNNLNNQKKKYKKSERNLMCWVSFVLVITQLLGIFMFSQGFFPRKTTLEGYNSFANYEPSCTADNGDIKVEAQFGKVVFMLVDAFKSNFLFGEENSQVMSFTQSLLDSGRAHGYIARADAPTVTLPRIKALLSGGIPSFVDFVNNFNSQTLKEDNILYQMKQSNKSMLFFGDDTWLKLFPDYFKRHDGTTSFYVADTVEVDLNVTRHLEPELNNNDWDVMFLHYLGLDHIGHLEGPHSNLMKPKQKEIDNIIKLIHTKLLEKDKIEMENYLNLINNTNNNNNNKNKIEKPLPTLFIFCSDHGMNEIGNHGGSSDSETSAVLVLMSSLYYNQNDIIVDHNNFEIKNHHNDNNNNNNNTEINNNNNNNNTEINNKNNNNNTEINNNNNNNINDNNINDNNKTEELITKKEIEDNLMIGQGRSDTHYHDPEILPKFQPGLPPKEISQVDLVPTLSLLLGLPIPKNSLGSLIPELFEKFIPSEQYLRALEINCQQQIEIIKHNSIFWKDGVASNAHISSLLKMFTDAQQYHSSWITTPSHSSFNDNAAELYLEFLSKVQDQFKSLLTTFDDNLLMVGILLIGSSALVTLLITISTIGVSEHNGTFEIKGVKFVMTFVGLIIILLTIHFGIICKSSNNNNDSSSLDGEGSSSPSSSKIINNLNPFCTNEFRYGVFSFIFTALSLLIGFNALFSKNNIKFWSLATLSPLQLRKEKYVLIVGTILHLISLFGSSLVEEEHLTWYFLTTSVILLQMAPHSISLFFYFTNWISSYTNNSNNNNNNIINNSNNNNINNSNNNNNNNINSSTGINSNINQQNRNTKQQQQSLQQMFILLGILVCLRIFRIWNQTGIKWMDDPKLLEEGSSYIDVGRFLNAPNIISSTTMWVLSLISIIAPCYYVFGVLDDLEEQRGGISTLLSKIYKTTIVILSVFLFCYKWEYIGKELINPAYIARVVYFCWAILQVITFSFPYFSKKDRVSIQLQQQNLIILPQTWFIATLKYLPTLVTVNMYMLFLLLHKVHNMFLLTIMGVIAHYYILYLLEDTGRRAKSGMTGVCVGMICLGWLGQFGYFAFGNSNSLASIDISGSYTALIDYNQYLVGIQTLLIGYTSQLFFFFVSLAYVTHLAVKSISNSNHQQEPSLLPSPGTSSDIIDELQWYGLVSALLDCGIRWTNIFIFSICILIQRYHLFIWTVFSPKYIYEVLDVTLVLIKSILLAAFIIYLRLLSFVKEKQVENNSLASSQNINKEE